MSDIDLTDLRKTPRMLMCLYIEQLFKHLGDKVTSHCEKIDPVGWILLTPDSYGLWLSYAMVELSSGAGRLNLVEGKSTVNTTAHREFLKKASEDDLRAYHKWAFPPSMVEQYWTNYCPDYFVSPVHFWFFMSCVKRNPPLRPISPNSPDDLFRHPLFLMSKYTAKDPLLLVVPEYFFRPGATFDGTWDPRAVSYYVFPYFAQRLFEYVVESATGSFTGPFIDYYIVRETAWLIPTGIDAAGFVDTPHPVLRRHWRWEEVLAMLYKSPRDPKKGRRPRVCQDAPFEYKHNQQIRVYFESFARMAAVWKPRT